MLLVVGIGIGDAREQVLIGFAGQQIAVFERLLAEIGEQIVAALVGDDMEPARGDGLAVQSLGGLGGGSSLRGGHGDQRHFRGIGLGRRDPCACACCGIGLDGCVEYICFTHIFCATLARISEIHDAPVRPLMGNFVPQLFDSGRKRPV